MGESPMSLDELIRDVLTFVGRQQSQLRPAVETSLALESAVESIRNRVHGYQSLAPMVGRLADVAQALCHINRKLVDRINELEAEKRDAGVQPADASTINAWTALPDGPDLSGSFELPDPDD